MFTQLHINYTNRKAVTPAVEKSNETVSPAIAMRLSDGPLITGRTSNLLRAVAHHFSATAPLGYV